MQRLTSVQRRASVLLTHAINLCTLLPLASNEELELLAVHLDELIESIVQEYDEKSDTQALDILRDLAIAISVAVRRVRDSR